MGDEESLNIVKIRNELYFYEDVTAESILELNTQLRIMEREYEGLPIILYIHSNGGELFAGLSGMDHIKSCKKTVYTVADGICCSAATFLFLGGQKRFIKPHAHFLIHQISADSEWVKFEDMKDEMNNLQRLMDKVIGIYRELTNLPEKKLKRLMRHDIYLDADECVKYDIAHDMFTKNTSFGA